MSRDISPFPVRLPAELREKLDAASADMGRSLNSELISRLEQSFGVNALSDADLEAAKLAFGHGFAAAMIYSLGRKIREEVEFRIPETSPDVLELVDDTIKFFLEQLERDHQYAAKKLSAGKSPVLKRPTGIASEPRKAGEPVLKDPRRKN